MSTNYIDNMWDDMSIIEKLFVMLLIPFVMLLAIVLLLHSYIEDKLEKRKA